MHENNKLVAIMSYDEIFDASYERVLVHRHNGKDFFECFYDYFLESSPRIREKFKETAMENQHKMLKKSFYSLLVFYGSNQADDYLIKIAQKHDSAHFDIHPDLYDIWLDTLMTTLRNFDPKFENDVELAWRLVLSPGITYMKFKYDHQV